MIHEQKFNFRRLYDAMKENKWTETVRIANKLSQYYWDIWKMPFTYNKFFYFVRKMN